MKKVILKFDRFETIDEVQDYLAGAFAFPEYYGRNLDALYDCLTDLDEYTCVGLFLPKEESPLRQYAERMTRVFLDAEEENRRLGVIYAGNYKRNKD